MSTYKKILEIVTPAERSSMWVLVAFMVIGMVLESLGIGLVIPMIALLTTDDIVGRYPTVTPVLAWLGYPSRQTLAVFGMLTLVGVYLIKTVFLGFLAWWQIRFVSRMQNDLSLRLFAIYLRQPYIFHLQRNSAQLIVNINSEVNYLANALSGILCIGTESLIILGIAVLLLIAEPTGALIVVTVVGGIGWGFYNSVRARIARWGRSRRQHDVKRMQHLQQGLSGIKDLIVLGREEGSLAQFSFHNTQSTILGQYQGTLMQFPRLWLELLAVIGVGLLTITMVVQGRELASIMSILGLFAAAGFRLIPSVSRVMGAMQYLRYGLSAIDNLHEELKLMTPEPVHQADIRHTFKSGIKLVNIAYIYPGTQTPTLDSITISINKGECVGFIGPSGSGKSTLIDVVLGLLSPSVGHVMVDGKDIRQNLRDWQNQIGYVPQSIYLTDDSLKNNVAFGLSDAKIDDAAVQRAIKAAQLDQFVSSLPDGLATMVGERGVRLSGGQRQRIGIARALYHDPAVLVLDEATSALDTLTESDVMQAVTALQSSKTILIIAHRLSTVDHCDRIYRLEQGKVVSSGTPAEMLASQMDSSILVE